MVGVATKDQSVVRKSAQARNGTADDVTDSTASLSTSRRLLENLQNERKGLEKDMRVFGESYNVLSDDDIAHIKNRMERRVADILESLDSYKSSRMGIARTTNSMFGEKGKSTSLPLSPHILLY